VIAVIVMVLFHAQFEDECVDLRTVFTRLLAARDGVKKLM